MLVHCDHPSPRARYVIRQVLGNILGFHVEFANEVEVFRSAIGPRMSYGTQRFDGAVHVPWSGALVDLPKIDPQVIVEGERRSLFMIDGEEDVFAGIFYLLSLQDELRCTERDAHDRIPSAALFTVRHGFADRPWVEEKALELGLPIERMWPGESTRRPGYRNIVTVDMDNILRYAGRSWSRAIGASLKDVFRGAWPAVVERWQVRARTKVDPFLKATDLVQAYREKMDRAIFFFLMRGESAYDHAADPRHPVTRESMERAVRIGDVGLHPSYATSRDHRLAEEERITLQRIIGKDVRISRQHFLRWRLPDTLRHSAAWHHEDHSLGFSDRAGFRAGTCTPFPWYDLEHERATELMLHPFAVMDSALIEQQGMGPAEVVRTMNAMSDGVRAVGGQFVSVWHDRYLSGHREFAPWPEVFEQVMQHANP